VVEPIGTQSIPGYAVTVVDTTAAGDAFNGGLGVGLARGMDLAAAVRYAHAVAALSVTRLGAQPSLPTQVEVDGFVNGR
jgi:ribokinase